jgi:hypothetical protein
MSKLIKLICSSLTKGLSNVFGGWVCTKIIFFYFTVVFVSPQEGLNFLWGDKNNGKVK